MAGRLKVWNDSTSEWEYVNAPGSSPTTATTTLTLNRAGSFAATHVFDLGYPAVALAIFTISSLTPAGETYGADPGEIQVVTDDQVSNLGVTYQNGDRVSENATLVAVSDTENVSTFTGRYLKVAADIEDSDFSLYAGANDPVAVVAVSVTYL